MKRLLIRCAAMLLALALLPAGCAAKEEPAPEATKAPEETQMPAADEKEAPVGIMSDFSAADLDGNEVTAESAFAGYDLVMVNVWGTFCGPCISEMPDLGELSDELAERNIRIVGIVSDAMDYEGKTDETIVDAAKEIVAQTGADYLHIVPSADLIGLLYQIQAVPTTFFVDETGCQVGMAYAGAMSKDEWKKIIEETLKAR